MMRVFAVREIPFQTTCICCKSVCYVMQSELVGLQLFQQVEAICNHCHSIESLSDLDEEEITEIQSVKKCSFANLISGIRQLIMRFL